MALPGVNVQIQSSCACGPRPEKQITEGGIIDPANFAPVGLLMAEGEKKEELLSQMQSRR